MISLGEAGLISTGVVLLNHAHFLIEMHCSRNIGCLALRFFIFSVMIMTDAGFKCDRVPEFLFER